MRAFRLVLAALTLGSCLDPTEIMVAITTNVPCNMVRGTAVAVGASGDDSTGVATSTTMCDDTGHIGTLAVLPSGGSDDTVGIRVTLGLTVSPDVCSAPSFAGCIVARRTLRYGPHRRLDLPIELDEDCANVPCDSTSTCVHGGCTDAGIECDDAGACTLPSPDAGSDGGTQIACGVPMLVVPGAPMVTPHLAKMNSGYGLAWDHGGAGGSGRKALVETFDGTGVTAGPTTAVDLGPNALVGPFATDGVHYALLTTDLTFDITYGTPGIQGATIPVSGAMPVLPVAGLFFSASRFMFMGIGSAEQSFELETFTPPSATASAAFGSIGVSGSFALDMNATSLYATDFGTTCSVRSYDATTLSIVGSTALSNVGCDLVVMTNNGAPEAIAFQDTTLTFKVFDGPNFASKGQLAIGAADPSSFVVMPSGAGFRVLHALNGAIEADVVDTNANLQSSTPVAQAGDFYRVTWDAVSDGPLRTSYGVAWWSTTPSPGFWFERFCN